jgi:hypothetical protein
MMNKRCKVGVAIFLFFFSKGLGHAEKLAFNLSGGMSYLFVPDINQGIKGYFDYRKQSTGVSVSGEAKSVHLGFDFEGNFLLNVAPRIWVGLGAGYIHARSTSEISMKEGLVEIRGSHKTGISAVPLRLGISYVFFRNKVMKLQFSAGTSLFFANYKYERQPIAAGEMSLYQTARAKGIGLQGGLGWELKLTRNTAFILDSQARYAKIGGFKGTIVYKDSQGRVYEEKGALYFWEQTFPLGNYPQVYIKHSKPSGPDISNVREARIDFSGFSLTGGVKFYF